MTTYKTTVRATPKQDYKIDVTFSNGERGIFDITPYLGYDCYAPLKNPDIFSQVVAAHGTLMWPGEIDIAPEVVWEDSQRVFD